MSSTIRLFRPELRVLNKCNTLSTINVLLLGMCVIISVREDDEEKVGWK